MYYFPYEHYKPTFAQPCTYTIVYYLVTRKKNILPFVKTWRVLGYIMLGDINQTEKDKICMIALICETSVWKSCARNWRVEWWLPGFGEVGEIGRCSSTVKNCSVIRWISSGDLIHRKMIIVNNTVSLILYYIPMFLLQL